MAQYGALARDVSIRSPEEGAGKRGGLFRSLSSTAVGEPYAASRSKPTAVDEHNEVHRSTRKLRRRPSATSISSRDSSSAAVRSGSRPPPPIPLSEVALNFQTSTTSLISSESGHAKTRKSTDVQRPHSGKRSISHISPPNDGLCHLLPTPLAEEQLERRKAHMSKLMRHFGESRIPAELISTTPRPSVSEERPRLPKARSLDLRPFAHTFATAAAGTSDGVSSPFLARTQSLGVQRRRGGNAREPSSALEGCQSEISRKVKRTRKITKILGPEVTRELMAMLEEEPPTPGPQSDHVAEDKVSVRSPSPNPGSNLQGNITDIDETEDKVQPMDLVEPDSPVDTDDPERNQHKRVHKLANFFGVDHLTVSSSIMVTSPTQPTTANHSEETLPEAHPAFSSVTEIDVQIAGRRFWGMSRVKGETKHAHMSEAIHQLRGLKAG